MRSLLPSLSEVMSSMVTTGITPKNFLYEFLDCTTLGWIAPKNGPSLATEVQHVDRRQSLKSSHSSVFTSPDSPL